ncbi:MAG TPA: DUF4365 domain-containing protein [Bryobacteraceae bacterium]|nr:DUF4365 domain-containing protein [Bryobacteraceae bacterium]
MHYKHMVRRAATHVIDTKAVRTVIAALPESWLVRGLEERDYGIDMMLEIFDEDYPTGDLVFAQIKGTESKFCAPVKHPAFPVKTLLYAELFVQPFFIFYCSLADKLTHFVWLQKYIQAKLDHETSCWRNQHSVAIHFPPDNVLSSNARRIVEIARRQRLRDAGISFLAAYEWLHLHSTSLLSGQTGVASACLACLDEIRSQRAFLDEVKQPFLKYDLDELTECFSSVRASGRVDDHTRSAIEEQLEELEAVKLHFLGMDDVDRFAVEMSDAYPY